MKTSRLLCHKSGYAVAACLAAAFLTSAANASIIFTAEGTSAGVPVSSTATFTAGAGSMTIVLQNITPHTADANQLLTGLTFKLANGSTAITSAGFSATGEQRTVAGDGTYSDSGVNTLSWELKTGTTLQADFNPTAKDAIIGPADDESDAIAGIYNGNGSINGNPGHNPYAAEEVTLVLTNPLITANTSVTNVSFIYNTSLSTIITTGSGHLLATPEPAALSVLGLGSVGLLARRKRA